MTFSREACGLGLSEEVARRRVATFPGVLNFSKEFIEKRAAFLETLGVPNGRAAIARQLTLLCSAEVKLHSNAEWLLSQGLDVKQALSTLPALLMFSAKRLSPKVDFMLNVVWLDVRHITARCLSASLDNMMRPRFFYAMQHAEQRYAFSSLVISSEANFLKMIHRLDKPATVNEIAAYKAHIATPAFRAYMDEQAQALRARGPRIEHALSDVV